MKNDKKIDIIRAFYKAFKSSKRHPLSAYQFSKEYSAFKKQNSICKTDLPITRIKPHLEDRNSNAAEFGIHYTNQDLHVANRIFQNAPSRHLDVGSSINGFVCHVASYREIEILDIRPFEKTLKNVSFHQVNLMDDEQISEYIEYTDSLSCLHTLEHFGLGRYSDPIDPLGHIKGFKNLSRLLKPNGIFYLSVPIGSPRIVFNAHRIFSIEYLQRIFTEEFELVRFSYEDDQQTFFEDVALDRLKTIDELKMNFGCGIFELRKKAR